MVYKNQADGEVLFIVMAGGYFCRDGGSKVQLGSVASRGGAGVAGVRLHAIGSRMGKTNKLVCMAAQYDTRGFYGFYFDL